MEKKLYESIQEVVIGEGKGKAEYGGFETEAEWKAHYALSQAGESMTTLSNALIRLLPGTREGGGDQNPTQLANIIKKHVPTSIPSGKKLHKMIPELINMGKFFITMKKTLDKATNEIQPMLKKGKVGSYGPVHPRKR